MEIFFGTKSSLGHYGLSLQSYTLTPPVRKRYLYSVAGANGQTDLLKGMGPPRYEERTLRATFKISGADPQQTVDHLINDLEGETVPIILPNDPGHYLEGDVHITSASIRQGGEVVIVATCLPWRYKRQEVLISIAASDEDVTHTWYNIGKRDAVPELTFAEPIYITLDGVVSYYEPGTYLMTDLSIPGHGAVSVTIRGGPLTVRYKEAIL